MQSLKIGILSDTHITRLTPAFQEKVNACFSDVSVILHAGDLTEPAILNAFAGKEVHAVHGNMCSLAAHQGLPTKKVISIKGYNIGLIHRTGYSYDFEELLINEFDDIDCIIFGHTHRPCCRKEGEILYVNPGSFTGTGRYGAPGTYAILELGEEIQASIHEVPRS